MSIMEFLARLTGVKKSGSGWTARCPAHDDGNASLSIKEGKDSRILLKCFAGCPVESVVGALGLHLADLFPPKTGNDNVPARQIVATYDYTDEAGALLFQCVRYRPKDFKQRRPDPARPGGWIWNLNGVRRVLYRLPEILAALKSGRVVFIAEGEKDVDALAKAGCAGTCNPMGAGKWLPEHAQALAGAARVVVIADKDPAGRRHACLVAASLRDGVESVRLIELPDREGQHVKDAADWFAAGGTADELRALVNATAEFVPTAEMLADEPKTADGEQPPGDDQEEDGGTKPARKSLATRLVQLADEFAFFHDLQSRAFVRVELDGHSEIWPVNSSQFRNLLARTFYKRTGTAINRNALADAIATLAGRASYDGPEAPVFLRVAPHGESILIDLCDSQWRVVEVVPTGWRVLERSPVAFFRTGAMRPLPVPASARDGSLDPLWDLLNVSPAQRPLVAGAILNGFHPSGPYFVVNFNGEQGTAKSCAAKIQRMLIDPNENPLRSPPREERDLLVHGANNWCVVLDNLSWLPAWLSDSLCRLATGGGHSARQLFSDGEEFTLAVKRPVILTGIEDVATRPDLAERALQIELEPIPDNRRKSEKELWRNFEAARPVIFAGILNGLACALRELPNVHMEELPRMADAALWATAGETAFGWPTGTFIAAYSQNLKEGAIASLDAHPVGVALRELLDGTPEWTGEPAHLLEKLSRCASDELRHSQNWPKAPRALSAVLRRMAQALRRAGIALEFGRGKRRTVRLCKRADFASPASPASPDSPTAAAGDANDADLQPLHDGKAAETRELVEEVA